MAELEFALGHTEEAYRLLCEALQNPQEPQYKLGSLLHLARMALALDEPEVAAYQVALARVIRQQQGWSVPEELTQLEQESLAGLSTMGKAWPSSDVRDLARHCEAQWREGARRGQIMVGGTIKGMPEGKSFAFIERDDGEGDIYVQLRDIPSHCRHKGAEVEFVVAESFDQKKGQASFRATQVRAKKSA